MTLYYLLAKQLSSGCFALNTLGWAISLPLKENSPYVLFIIRRRGTR